MHRKTKTKPLIVAFMLLCLGWAQPGWSVDLNADMRTLTNELAQKFESVRTGPYGAFVYRNISTIAIIYSLVALSFLLSPEYRDRGWHNLLIGCVAPLVVFACFVVAYAIAMASKETFIAHGGHHASPVSQGGDWLITLATGLIHPLLMIALILAIWIGIPLYLLFLLFTLPSMLFVILRFLVWLPILTYHHLHYLSVPHPAETAYRTGIAHDLPMEELASVVADAMFLDHEDLDALPPAWKSRNQKKRADAFKDLVNAEGPLMEAIMANLEMKDKLREHRRTKDV